MWAKRNKGRRERPPGAKKPGARSSEGPIFINSVGKDNKRHH